MKPYAPACLRARAKPNAPSETHFRVEPSHCGFRPGVDLAKLNQQVDEQEAEDFRHESETA